VKVRIGVSAGVVGGDEDFSSYVEHLENIGIDSLWLSEVVSAPMLDPIVGMTHALGMSKRLKVGTGVMVLPGRHPVLVAKQLVSLAVLAPGRVLPVFGLQPARAWERAAFAVPPGRRADVFDESLRLLRLLVTEPSVTFDGEFFSVDNATVGLLPAEPLDIWLGGRVDAALQRIGRLGDGWLASLVTPAEAARGLTVIESVATECGRVVDPEHFGISLAIGFGDVSPDLARSVAKQRPDVDVTDLIPIGWEAARRRIEEYVDAGISKFVVRAAAPVASHSEFASQVLDELGPLQT
jgi:probable F420-dependent oxidoreductase